jgi:hypothetical protein
MSAAAASRCSARSAQKKPPERLCPRGAKDTDFSGSDWTLPHRGAAHCAASPQYPDVRQSSYSLFKASRPLPCRRWFASWSAGEPLQWLSRCRPTRVNQNEPDPRLALARTTSIWLRQRSGEAEDMAFPIPGQGRFSGKKDCRAHLGNRRAIGDEKNPQAVPRILCGTSLEQELPSSRSLCLSFPNHPFFAAPQVALPR